jgi:hypothetical protein
MARFAPSLAPGLLSEGDETTQGLARFTTDAEVKAAAATGKAIDPGSLDVALNENLASPNALQTAFGVAAVKNGSGDYSQEVAYFYEGSAPATTYMKCDGQFTTGNVNAAANFGLNTPKLDLYPAPVVSTFATGFTDPIRIIWAPNGLFYVLDSIGVHSITPAGVVATVATGVDVANSVGITWCSLTNSLLVARNDIRQVTPAGVVTTLVAAGFGLPNHNSLTWSAVDQAVYSTAQSPIAIYKTTLPGLITTQVTLLPAITFGLEVGADGHLYSTNPGLGQVLKITLPAGTVSTLSTGVVSPRQISQAQDGNLYSINGTSESIEKTTLLGVTSTWATAVYASPQGVCQGPDGNFYCTEFGTDTVLKVTNVVPNTVPYVKR